MQNLVWKLDLVARGIADEELLDTYESERKPHATFWVKTAADQAVMIQTTDPEVAAGRDAFIKAHPEASAVPTSEGLGVGLHEGDRDERAGKLSVQPILQDGTRLDDMVGTHFVVAADRGALQRPSRRTQGRPRRGRRHRHPARPAQGRRPPRRRRREGRRRPP